MYAHKVLSITKLSLALLLLFVLVRTVFIPVQTREILGPAAALGTDDRNPDKLIYQNKENVEDYSRISAIDLFGTATKSVDREGWKSSTDALCFGQSTSEESGLALLGTVSGNPEIARAIIKNLKTGVLDLYRTGQMVGDARIETIESDAVILLHRGETKTLGLTSWHSGANGNKNNAESRTDYMAKRATETLVPSSRDGVDKQSQISPVEEVLTKAVIEPYVINGQIEGLRIIGLEDLTGGNSFGLKNGDIIHTINGHRLTSKQKAFQVLKKARSSKNITMELMRNNRVNKLSFELR